MKKEYFSKKEEDYLLQATLIMDGYEINSIPCKLFLPERTDESPYIILKPEFPIGDNIWKFGLKAEVTDHEGKALLTVLSPDVYIDSQTTNHWGDGQSDITIFCEPQDLQITNYGPYSSDTEKTTLVFWVSPNRLLQPATINNHSYTGSIEYEYVRKFEFDIGNGLKHEFLNHFRHKTESNGDIRQWSHLVSSCITDIPAIDTQHIKDNILYSLNDFLLITSFAARKRTCCFGWEATDSTSRVIYYRGDLSFPKQDQTSDDELISLQHLKEFFSTSYPAFVNFDNKLALRSALNTVISSKDTILEQAFISLFAALETLVLDFRRTQNLEFILPDGDWSKLQKLLKKAIKASKTPELNPEQRSSIYKKLSELNRPALQEAYIAFCNAYKIKLDGLWPIFKDSNGVGLIDIRNRIVHGDAFSEKTYHLLANAYSHLRIILERVLLRVLDWSIDKSRASSNYLSSWVPMIKLKESQLSLSNYFFKNLGSEPN